MHNPYVAIVAAALAAWIFGAVWYTALGKTWMAASGIPADEIERRRASRQMPIKPMIISFVSELVMALLLSWLLAGLGVTDIANGALTGFLLGAGFLATAGLVNNGFQGRSLSLSIIDGVHWTVVLVIEGVVLVVLS